MRALVLIVLVPLVVFPGAARAEDEYDEEDLTEIYDLVYDGEAEAGYQRLEPLVAQYPRDVELRDLAAEAAERTARDAESREHVEAGLAVQPDHAGLLAQSGYLYLEEGDLVKARPLLERAVAAQPDYQFALDTLQWVKNVEAARKRRDGTSLDLDPASPEWMVDHALERVFAGDTPTQLIGYVSPEIMKGVLPSDRTRANLLSYATSLQDRLRETAVTEQEHLEGWVLGETRADGDHVLVDVSVYLDQTPSAEAVDLVIEQLRADKPEEEVDWPIIADVLRETDASHWESMKPRIVGRHGLALESLTVELSKRNDVYRISGIVWDGVDIQDEIADHVTENYQRRGGGPDIDLHNPNHLGGILMIVAFGVGMIVLVVYLIVQRVNARRALARSNRRE